MAKRLCMLLLLGLLVRTGRAQILGGFFDQGATELKEYAAQIAALRLYINKAEQGYRIVETGLTDIGNIHQAEYGLHQAYFGSLAAVNPKIAGMPEVAEIIALQRAIRTGLTAAQARWKCGGGLTAGELQALNQASTVVEQAAESDVDALDDLLSPGKLTMTDDERMSRLVALDADMKRRYVFVQQFSAQADLLVAERKTAGRGAEAVQQYFGIH